MAKQSREAYGVEAREQGWDNPALIGFLCIFRECPTERPLFALDDRLDPRYPTYFPTA